MVVDDVVGIEASSAELILLQAPVMSRCKRQIWSLTGKEYQRDFVASS